MKKFIILWLIFIMFSITYAADVNVQINGDIISFEDTNAQIINDRTMVPFRKIFNKLGVTDENINWDGETKTIIAKNKSIEIKLQIGNNIAEKKIDGISNKITLDSAPVIRNDRTLVPLRFIAESLGKTVGWDAANKTAIIIDYDYFMNTIKNKSNELYNFFMADSSNETVTITRNYTDLSDAGNNNTAIVKANISEKTDNVITQNVTVSFLGTNELMQDIKEEGWSEIKFENTYYNDYFTTKALNDSLKKVYGNEQMKFKYDALDCSGKYNDNAYNLFKNLCNINENSININTFKERKTEFETLLGLFKSNGSNSYVASNIVENLLDVKYFDFTKFDNVLCNTPENRVFNFLNSQIFNYDINLEELCYDYPKINSTITINNLELTINFVLANDYNEKVEYIIKIVK